MKASYMRLYSDDEGESHFEQRHTDLALQDFAPPAAPVHTGPFLPAAQLVWVGVPRDWRGDTPHPSPRRQVFCTVTGEYEVTASDGEVRSFPPGSILLLDDTVGRGHSTRVVGDAEVLILGVTLTSDSE